MDVTFFRSFFGDNGVATTPESKLGLAIRSNLDILLMNGSI
jgi:hypothetical protein